MSKYEPLWRSVGGCGQKTITLTFDAIQKLAGFPMDHSFLRYKNELTEYGYLVEKISMKAQTVTFKRMESRNPLVLYIHGKGGTADEAAHYRPLFPDCDVTGLDYHATTPWEAQEEFPAALQSLCPEQRPVLLIANSIGAYFAMCSLPQERIKRAYFISPIVDMERLIGDMMRWAQVDESELQKKGSIETAFGETLSWPYLCYVRSHPVQWRVATEILYGQQDHLTSMETISAFAKAEQRNLTIMENGEHWFHTPEQMAFLNDWILKHENA